MITFEELNWGLCRYPIGTQAPYLFCGESARGTYCVKHHKLCHGGRGKSWEGLAGMIDAVEDSVIVRRRVPADVQEGIDQELRRDAA